ncbi:unnamed protein product, partial [Cyprideis torosa]
MTTPAVDQPVDDFEAPLTSDKTFRLSDYQGKNLVLYFYPKDSTPGCTTEGQDFRDAYAEFQAADTEIVGISRDGLKAHENFKAKQSFPFELISDKEEAVCNLFDVIKMKNMYGRQEHDVFLPMVVLEELDKGKKGVSEVARNVRQVSRFLDELIKAEEDQSLSQGVSLDANHIFSNSHVATTPRKHESRYANFH